MQRRKRNVGETLNMNIESSTDGFVASLIESRSFKRNKCHWLMFYASSIATAIMFVILCSLSIWSLSVAHKINSLVGKSADILKDVEEMLPILSAICTHSNFTRTYGSICTFTR